MPRFSRYLLRTTDVEGARAFYRGLGLDGAAIAPLPVEVVARGGRPHWLGVLGVDDVEETAAAFVARGATRLGPTRPTGGGRLAVLRDAGGALLGLGAPAETPAGLPTGGPAVVWHEHATLDVARAAGAYTALCGWSFQGRIDLGSLGVHQLFAWEAGGAQVGSFGAIGEAAGRADVHPQWLFQFRVSALAPAIAAVRATGGLALDPVTLPDGTQVAACDDPQGAAFALRA